MIVWHIKICWIQPVILLIQRMPPSRWVIIKLMPLPWGTNLCWKRQHHNYGIIYLYCKRLAPYEKYLLKPKINHRTSTAPAPYDHCTSNVQSPYRSMVLFWGVCKENVLFSLFSKTYSYAPKLFEFSFFRCSFSLLATIWITLFSLLFFKY